MIENLTATEMEVATNLISGGLTMAKSSMEQILQSPMELKKIDYGNENQGLPQFSSKKTDKMHLVKTELMGELAGSCFLIFSEEEVVKINKACLPPEIMATDSEENEMMKTAFLKEMDNMVAASAVTEFSNILDLELFGGVPNAYVFKTEEVDGYLSAESKVFKTVIHFKANFQCDALEISPDFIWMFGDEFADKIKDIV